MFGSIFNTSGAPILCCTTTD